MNDIHSLLTDLYSREQCVFLEAEISRLIEEYRLKNQNMGTQNFDEKDAVLITYGDQLYREGEKPLKTLLQFCKMYLKGVVSSIHFLPFFPYSSDDGFSVIDYNIIDEHLGNWEDVAAFHPDFRLMFDFVCNHISVKSNWFQDYLSGKEEKEDYFIEVSEDSDLSMVVRPRTLPLLNTYETANGPRSIWTTFSADQVDLNYKNPKVLLDMLKILLFYCHHKASMVRLDAIAYLWKEIGTSCIHLPQTHRVIQIFRNVLDEVYPHVTLITETNVPHRDNISYFGEDGNEAQMVYNFALPPLILHTFHTQNSYKLTQWASRLSLPSHQVTFFNFLASHDGIGLNPAREILEPEEIQSLVNLTGMHGGFVSYKSNPDGTQSPYELNINYFDALSNPNNQEDIEVQIDRFICAHAIMFSLQGLPAIYFHSLFGSRSWRDGVKKLNYNRAINREKCDFLAFSRELDDPQSIRHRVFHRLADLLKIRAQHPALSPYSTQKILPCGPSLFAILRSTGRNNQGILCLHNVTGSKIPLNIDLKQYFVNPKTQISTLNSYQFVWFPGTLNDPIS